MSYSRKNWQNFKKTHPEFEKSKNFKSDIGPQLDAVEKAYAEFMKVQNTLSSKAEELVKLAMSLEAAFKGYEQVVNQLKSSDKTIEKDFAQFPKGVASDLKVFENYVKNLNRIGT